MAMHRHDHLEVVHCLQGGGTTRGADGSELRFAAGDTCIHPAGSRHDRRFAVPGSSLVLRLRLDPPVPAALRRPLLVSGPPSAWLAAELRALAAPQVPVAGWARLALDLRASAVLCTLLAQADQQGQGDADADLAERAARLIAERLATIGRLPGLARELGVPHDRLRRVFRRQRGQSLLAWLTEVRARRAHELLLNSSLTLAEVARQCGYGNARYLARIYRRLYGIAPGATRRG